MISSLPPEFDVLFLLHFDFPQPFTAPHVAFVLALVFPFACLPLFSGFGSAGVSTFLVEKLERPLIKMREKLEHLCCQQN
jgi:hypothetical protein